MMKLAMWDDGDVTTHDPLRMCTTVCTWSNLIARYNRVYAWKS